MTQKPRTSAAVKGRYDKKAYDRPTVRLRKDDLSQAQVQQAADAVGETLNAYIINAIKARMATNK